MDLRELEGSSLLPFNHKFFYGQLNLILDKILENWIL